VKVFSAKVVNGQIDVGDVELLDGATVTVMADDDTSVELTDEQRTLLRESLAQADRGETLDAAHVLKSLRP
jgi:transcriptional regulator of nitric oxide reductase